MYESEADAKIINGKWLLKPHKARHVLRGFEEDVKDEDVFVSTTMAASVRIPLSQATDLRIEGYTKFTTEAKTVFLNAHNEDGDVVYAKKATRVATGNTGSEQKDSDLETIDGLRSTPRRWQDHLEQILRKCGFVPNMLDTCLWTHTTKRVSLVFHANDLLLAGTHQISKEIIIESSRDLGRTLVKTKEVQLLSRCFVCGEHAGGVQHLRAQELTNTAMGTP